MMSPAVVTSQPLHSISSKADVVVTADRADREPQLNTINDLLVHRANTTPGIPIVAYPAPGSNTKYVHYTAQDLDRFADEAARQYMTEGMTIRPSVVALLAPSNIDYVVSMFALSRLGHTVLFLSNRLSVHAILSLFKETGCDNIVATLSFSKVIEKLRAEKPDLQVFDLLQGWEYDLPIPSGSRLVVPRVDSDKPVFIVHSSGSTGVPKPIWQTHRTCLYNYSSSFGLKGFITLPLYHNHGISCFFRALYAGKEISFYSSELPMTAENLASAMDVVQPGIFYGVPYALKLLAETARGIDVLRSCDLVLFGGSSCPDELGNKLVDAGVRLVGHYGLTEVGQLMTSFRPIDDKTWNYLRVSDILRPYLIMEPTGPNANTYEAIVLDGWKGKIMSNSDDPPNSYRTQDLFSPHPSIQDAWKYLGRVDDRVTLVNGEKVLPIPIEGRVRQDPNVKECVVFGAGRDVPGIIIIAAGDDVDIIDAVMPAIEDANSRAESFSHISREMVKVLPATTEYPRTDKGTVIRAAFYETFKNEIEDVYVRLVSSNTQKLDFTSVEQAEAYLLLTFGKIGVDLESHTTDFFLAGVDSLQAIRVWSTLKRNVELGGGGGNLSQNVVYEQPNVQKLARHILSLKNGETQAEEDEIDTMRRLVQKYSTFNKHIPSPGVSAPDKQTILLTGTTGSLGAYVLDALIRLPNVSAVYCPVRASTPGNARDRVLSTLRTRKLLPPPWCLDKITALPSDFNSTSLGFPDEVVSHLQSALTCVIHCAWSVNFNLSVASFEQQSIKGAYNLINFCVSTHTPRPASFYFASSISAAAGTPLPAVIPEGHIENLNYAQNMGYARSKLVTEHIVRSAARATGMTATVLRIGQIVGDSKEGLWNDTEAIPLMIRSAVTVGCLPDIDETPSWLAVDHVARSILELCNLSTNDTHPNLYDPELVYHVQNPSTFSWTRDLIPALRSAFAEHGVTFNVVPQREWVRRLRGSEQDPAKNPTVKLTSFFAEKYDNDRPGRKGLVFEMEESKKSSVVLNAANDVVSEDLVRKFVARWMESWGI